MALQNFPWGFPRKHSNALCARKSYSGQSTYVELTEQYLLSEFHPKQTKAACVNRVVNDHSLWASMAVGTTTSFT